MAVGLPGGRHLCAGRLPLLHPGAGLAAGLGVHLWRPRHRCGAAASILSGICGTLARRSSIHGTPIQECKP